MTGKDLKTKLELIGIPLRQVAEVLGISEQNLQNKLSAADIKVSFLCRLSLKLHKSIYFFLDGQEFCDEEGSELSNKNSSFSVPSAPPSSVSPADSSLALRLIDKLDEKDKEIKILNEKLLATSITLSEYRLGEAAAIAKNTASSVVAVDLSLPHSSSPNAISADVP